MTEELKLQLSLLAIKYSESQIDLDKIDWDKFFITASNNRILFYCCKTIAEANSQIPDSAKNKIEKEILPVGREYIEKTRKALEFLNCSLTSYPFLICKTEKLIEYVTFDVDVLFKKNDYKNVLEYLGKLGGEYIDCEKKMQGDIIMPDMSRMDMHDNFHWQKSDFISVDQLWNGIEEKVIFGVECPAPNLENEVILNILNLIYERHYIPLLDYYFLLHHRNEINWEIVFRTARDYKWVKALVILLNKFNQIHYYLFDELLIDIGKFIQSYKLKKVNNLTIPFIFSYREGISVFWERLHRRHYFRGYEFLYFLFSKTRFHLSKGKRAPIYGHWIDFTNKL